MDTETQAKIDRAVAEAVERAGPQITDLAQRLKRAELALAARTRAARMALVMIAAFAIAGIAWFVTLSMIAEIAVAASAIAVSVAGKVLHRRSREFDAARAALARREPLPEARVHD